MAFPVPSETFASNDVLALCRAGVEVSVHSLRPPQPKAATLVIERELNQFKITHNSLRSSLRGLWIGSSQMGLLCRTMVWLVSNVWKNPNHLLRSLILLPRSFDLYHQICHARPDVVHLYWSHYPSLVGYLVQKTCPTIAVSISFVAHDIVEKYACTTSVARQADLIQTITAANVPAIQKLGIDPARILLSYHGVNLRHIPPAHQKIQRRIVTVGRLIPEKGFEEVLRIFSQVRLQWEDASLVVLGDGPDRENLERLAHQLGIFDAVSFRGHVSHDLVFKEMAIAEVFLFMSQYNAERLPNVVKEAMACRCLSVVTHTPGIEELMGHGVQGYVVPPGDLETATKHINDVFANPTQTAGMVDQACQHVMTNFDLDRIIQVLAQHWQQKVDMKKMINF